MRDHPARATGNMSPRRQTAEEGSRWTMKGNPETAEQQGQNSQGSWGSQGLKKTLCRKMKLIALVHWDIVRRNLYQQRMGMAVGRSLGIN